MKIKIEIDLGDTVDTPSKVASAVLHTLEIKAENDEEFEPFQAGQSGVVQDLHDNDVGTWKVSA